LLRPAFFDLPLLSPHDVIIVNLNFNLTLTLTLTLAVTWRLRRRLYTPLTSRRYLSATPSSLMSASGFAPPAKPPLASRVRHAANPSSTLA
jgi:hypothetical protein